MLKLFVFLLALIISIYSAHAFFEPEEELFGISGLESLSSRWFLSQTDSNDYGFRYPVDLAVLKISPFDHRVVVLDAYAPNLIVFQIPADSLDYDKITLSGQPPDTCAYAIAMCVLQQGEYFDPAVDRVAVLYQYGARVVVYQLDRWSNAFSAVSEFHNPEITKPVGIFSAFGQFFIAEEDSQRIYRTDAQGNGISTYGKLDYAVDGYNWISDISGYVDGATAHLYVSDGLFGRVDHLTTTAANPDILLHSQAWPMVADSFRLRMHEQAFIPGTGVVGFDRSADNYYFFPGVGAVDTTGRSIFEWDSPTGIPLHIRQAANRLFVIKVETGKMWDIQAYQVGNASFEYPLPMPTGHWTIAMSPIIITDSLRISGTWSNGELIIDAGVEVLFDQDAALIVEAGSRLEINGTAGNHVSLANWQSGESWGGIYVNGGELEASYADFGGTSQFAISTNSPSGSATPVLIEYCTFDGSQTTTGGAPLKLIGSASLKQVVNHSTISSVAAGYGLFLWNCFVSFDGVTVQGCSYSNSYLKQVTGNFRNCVFKDHTGNHGVLFSAPGTTPNFQCCSFDYVGASGAYNAPLFAIPGTAPTFGYEGSASGVSNTIKDSSDYLLKMYGSGVKPIIDNILQSGGAGGRNDWYQSKSSGKFINWASAPAIPLAPYSAQNQYWNHANVTVPTTNDFLPSSAVHYDFSNYRADPWGLCGGAGSVLNPGGELTRAALDEVTEWDSLFSVGVVLEAEEQFATAQELFHDVALNSLSSNLRWQAMSHVISTQRHLDNEAGELWIPGLFDVLQAADSFSYDSHVFGVRLLVSYRVDRAEFETAIGILVMLLSSGLNSGDSLLVADDLVGVQILSGSLEGSGLDDSAWERIPLALRVHSRAQGFALDRELLRQWVGEHSTDGARDISIPGSFKLYQNYPNPFNPTTELQFDVPEFARVKVQIFNTLGQLVTTLIDEQRAAGRHTITWDASALPSGLYVYRMEALGFADAKKMVLIR